MNGELFIASDAVPAKPVLHGPLRLARIAVERGIDGWQRGQADDTLTYRLGDEPVEVGQRVRVPLGRGATLVAGMVVEIGSRELLGSLSADKVKPIASVESVGLPAALVRLAVWMAEYYVSPLGLVLAAMMPAAVKEGVGRKRERILVPAERVDEAALATLGPRARELWQAVTGLDASQRPGSDIEWKIALRQPTLRGINELRRAGLLVEETRETVRASRPFTLPTGIGATQAAGSGLQLTEAQAHVVQGIARAMASSPARAEHNGHAKEASRGSDVHLLHGVTGSGKTEVYLRLIASVLDQGRTALMLVPEISLTPQTVGRLRDRFEHAGVAVMHSGLTASQRHAEWSRIAAGQSRLVLGARSAVFAPLANVGLVIVDEEHATDYKQDQLPRYHARDVAIKRAQLEGSTVVLGSATPSLESWSNATGPRARYQLWQLRDRVGGGQLPAVRVVDLMEERRQAARDEKQQPKHQPANPPSSRRDLALRAIGPTLDAELARTFTEGGQAILLLNRRGYASHICCASRSCGWVMLCDDCDAAQIWHKSGDLPKGGFLRCHHCLATRLLPRQCPDCQSGVIHLGMGTQRVEEELLRSHPHLAQGGLIRADGDSMRSATDWFDALEAFQRGQARVLLGTQMIAKGHDFPNVRLVGVINADTALALPDFRAGERTFQLVSQVAGRAGRGSHAGLVIVQTMNPADPAIEFASHHDYVGFAKLELEQRRRSNLPPAVRMARVVVRDRVLANAQAIAKRLADALVQAAEHAGARVIGPMPCPIARIAMHHRLGIEVYAPTAGKLASVLGSVRRQGVMRSDAATAIDVDPVALM